MKASDCKHVVIVGAGPTGCALASLLRQAGHEVTVFDNGVRPDLIVGESLIPAAIPILQKLGVEDEVSKISTLKPGASLFHTNGARVDFTFRAFGKRAPAYAYNISRPAFDKVLSRRAERDGAKIVAKAAKLAVVEADGEKRLQLSSDSMQAAGIDKAPDMLVDATGRSRLFSRLLNLSSIRGSRDDVAYFAHFENFQHDDVRSGQIIISILRHGWSWRIPLPGKLSVGVVLDKQAARRFGANASERLDNILAEEPLLALRAAHAVRVSDVKTYSNYQRITETGTGNGWALTGDAYGFVDPMLSPGVFMALESASLLAMHLDRHLRTGKPVHLNRYCLQMNQWHAAWQEAIEYLYDGRLLRLHQEGARIAEDPRLFSIGKLLDWHYRRVIASIISGAGTRSPLQRHMLRYAARHFESQDQDHDINYAVVDA